MNNEQPERSEVRKRVGEVSRVVSNVLDENYLIFSNVLKLIITGSAFYLVYKKTGLFTRYRTNADIPITLFNKQKKLDVQIKSLSYIPKYGGNRDLIICASHIPTISYLLPSFLTNIIFPMRNSNLYFRLFGLTSFNNGNSDAPNSPLLKSESAHRLEEMLMRQRLATIQLLYLDALSENNNNFDNILVCKLFHRSKDNWRRVYLNQELVNSGILKAREELPGKHTNQDLKTLREYNKEIERFHDLEQKSDVLLNPAQKSQSTFQKASNLLTERRKAFFNFKWRNRDT